MLYNKLEWGLGIGKFNPENTDSEDQVIFLKSYANQKQIILV
jgi:hypothetical protein